MAERHQIRDAAASNYGAVENVPPISGNPASWSLYPPSDQRGATAPPANLMDNVSGYEGAATGDGEGKVLPPPANLVPEPRDHLLPSNEQWNIRSISEDTAKEALVKYASGKCCYSTAPANEMIFHDFKPFNTYRYCLETFMESRSSEWVSAPYQGEFVDSNAFGPAPFPWDIQMQVPALFKDSQTKIKVPHTSSVKPCYQCIGLGRIRCKKCNAAGRVQCWVCNGSGRQFSDSRCSHCNGIGNETCSECNGTGHGNCCKCAATGQLLCYLQLIVKWKNDKFVFVGDQRSGFPTELFQKVTGKTIFTDEQAMVQPLMTFPDPDINEASQNAVQHHITQFASTARILRQRQTIELIPLTKVDYEWKGNRYTFFVYGRENNVYTEDYPAKCCCSVM